MFASAEHKNTAAELENLFCSVGSPSRGGRQEAARTPAHSPPSKLIPHHSGGNVLYPHRNRLTVACKSHRRHAERVRMNQKPPCSAEAGKYASQRYKQSTKPKQRNVDSSHPPETTPGVHSLTAKAPQKAKRARGQHHLAQTPRQVSGMHEERRSQGTMPRRQLR